MDDLAREILKDMALEEIAPRAQKRSPIDHWTPAVLLERAAYLKKMARYGDGSASETLRDYPQHAATVTLKCMKATRFFFACWQGRQRW
jgi:hypothetical protein